MFSLFPWLIEVYNVILNTNSSMINLRKMNSNPKKPYANLVVTIFILEILRVRVLLNDVEHVESWCLWYMIYFHLS